MDELREKANSTSADFDRIDKELKSAEQRLVEIAALKKNIINYAKTREVYVQYRKAGYSKAFLLRSATKSGLTMNEAALIQADSNLPLDVISQLHSMDEYLVYKKAGLKPVMVNGRVALVQNIDLNHVSQLPDGTEVTNLVRMQKGYAPLDPATGKAYQLHHIGQKADGTLAVLTEAQHQGNSAILNIAEKASEIDRPGFGNTRKEFWQYVGNHVFGNGGV